jgi:Protein of unknown function DUF262
VLTVNELTFDEALEDEDEQLGPPITSRKIYTKQADAEVEGLYRKYLRAKLIVQPDFQRHFIWDEKKASRLIESAILDIPIPSIYLAEEPDGREYVIDGQQRLMSFFSFIDGKFPNGKEFRLTGLKVLQELKTKNFKELDQQSQDKILYYKSRVITFPSESDNQLKFEVFERLNTGSVSLNNQELRNCIYHGKYIDLLREPHGSLIFIRVLRIYNVLYFLLLEDLSIFLIVFSGLLSAKWAVVHNTIEPALKVLCSSKLNFQFLEMNFQNERTVSN